jgi:predicted ribosomally synthesized peptide with SipW-like signal peptide
MLVIGLVATASYVGFSRAFFSDTETSTGNTITAGKLDLKIDSEAHYLDMVCAATDNGDYFWKLVGEEPGIRPELVNQPCVGSWELKDLQQGDTFFGLTDVKPGDKGENTISLHVEDNDAWACATVRPTVNDDVSSTEPELESGDVADTDSIFDGELAQNMEFMIWADTCNENGEPGDNVYTDGCDKPLMKGTGGPLTPITWALADKNSNIFTGVAGEPLKGANDYYIGVAWSLPGTVGNIVQSDKYMADISFYVEQSRNNPDFVCASAPTQSDTLTLRLENERYVENGPWEVIVDEKYVDMTYNKSGSTFDYSLTGKGLAPDVEYALIYYADGWPGNHPGALIGLHTADGSGIINTGSQSIDLNMDLPTAPDGNLAIGAKIWLIPSSAYNSATKSVIVWPPDYNSWFFEGNVYINYDDTDV